MNKPDFAKKYSPELQQKMKDRFAVPEIREAISFWVMQCCNLMGQAKSEKHILGFLLHRLAPYGCSIEEARYVLEMAQHTWAKQNQQAVDIAYSNSRIIQN